ncbi:ATP synthase subunit delta [bacterium HR34]|nr:ATP synthase subunit delta [bacterium HR34]
MKEAEKIKINRFVNLLYELYKENKLSDDVLKKVVVLLSNEGFLGYLETIIKKFLERVKAENKILDVVVESADELTENEKNKITEIIAKRFGSNKLNIKFVVREDLIGGVRIFVNNYLIDASFLKYINQLKH